MSLLTNRKTKPDYLLLFIITNTTIKSNFRFPLLDNRKCENKKKRFTGLEKSPLKINKRTVLVLI